MYVLRNSLRRAGKLVAVVLNRTYWRAVRNGVFPATEHEVLSKSYTFDTVLDVGANVGQFAIVASVFNSESKIYSFEPIRECFDKILSTTEFYPNIKPMNFGLGSQNQITGINISTSIASSSFLEISDTQNQIYPGTSKAGTCEATLKRLDDIANELVINGTVLLKIDTQGFELEVLKGAVDTLKCVDFIYLEGSFIELYDQQPLISDLIQYLTNRSFVLSGVFNVDFGKSELPAQADFLFRKVVSDRVSDSEI